jgi:hypothetical protein
MSCGSATFAADPGVIGSSVTLDGGPATVVGVLPARLRWIEPVEIYVPLQQNPFAARGRVTRFVSLIGRLRQGVSRDEAEREIDGIARRLGAAYPDSDGGLVGRVVPLREDWLGPRAARCWCCLEPRRWFC